MADSTLPPPIPECYAAGIALFNTQHFFEAHEAWESCWLRSEGRERMFYHGLIQAAAACVHLQHNRRKGAQLLYAKSHDKLQHYSGVVQGLAIGQFNQQFAEAFASVLAEPAEVPIDGAPILARVPQLNWTPPASANGAPVSPGRTPSFLKDESHLKSPDSAGEKH